MAYASLLCLTRVLDNLHYRAPFHLPLLEINLVQTLQQNVQFLLDFTELNHLETKYLQTLHLWGYMAKVAFEFEQKIDSHVVNLSYLRSQRQASDTEIADFCDDMEGMISRFEIIKKDLPVIHEASNKLAASVPLAAPPAAFSHDKIVVVGFDKHTLHIKDQLTRNRGDPQILSIVGMGGIGMTTFAKIVYDDPYIVNYFDRRIWVTISQEFSVEQILAALLDVGETCESSAIELGENLYREFFSRKYLIVMDDVCSTESWDELNRYFPDNGNGSHILVTTRQTRRCGYFHGTLDHYPLSFLDLDDSWDLFCQITFAQRGCPYAELEETRRAVAINCGGLPLGIYVIGRLLAKSDMTRGYWEHVDKNINFFGNLENDEHCLRVLTLIYKSLPVYLKPCFLYLGVFHEDRPVDIDTLIKYWVAEGFIKPTSDKTLEKIAEQYCKGS